MTTVIVTYDDWYAWAVNYESTLSGVPSSNQILIDSYNEAFDSLITLQYYLVPTGYRLLVYRLALHLLIINSGGVSNAILNALYEKYEIGSYAGIIQSAGSSPTSATKMIPSHLAEGDAETLALFSTPYGKYVEGVYQQLRGIAIVI